MIRLRACLVRAAVATATATALVVTAAAAHAAPGRGAAAASCADATGDPGGHGPGDGPGGRHGAAGASTDEAIVKIDVAHGYSISDLTVVCPVVVESAILASRGIYLVSVPGGGGPDGAKDLVAMLAHEPSVVYAEPNSVLRLDDTRWHLWSDGPLATAGFDPMVYAAQPAVATLGLTQAWGSSQGTGVTVAVLDTGADADHPALQGRLVPGWNYVDDNADTTERHAGTDDNGNGNPDDAYGHGTFVAGLVALVAPTAKVMPERVLDPDGFGNIFVISQAILDAVGDGANVINLSFGTATPISSHLLDDAIAYATARGVVVTAAAGNDHSSAPHFPAASRGVLSVSALSETGTSLASYSDFGPWVDVAAPGTFVVGPVPGGGYAFWSGTSMAAPFASGQAALLRAARPQDSSDQLVGAINRTATRIDHAQLAFGQINIPLSLAGSDGRRER